MSPARLASSGYGVDVTELMMVILGPGQIRLISRMMTRVYNGGLVVLFQELGRHGSRFGEVSMVR